MVRESNAAAITHTTAPINHTRPSPRKHSPDGAARARMQTSDYSFSCYSVYRPRKAEWPSWLSWLTCSGRFRPYLHKWSPISCRSSAGQGKFAGQRRTFYHCAATRTVCMLLATWAGICSVGRGSWMASRSTSSASIPDTGTWRTMSDSGWVRHRSCSAPPLPGPRAPRPLPRRASVARRRRRVPEEAARCPCCWTWPCLSSRWSTESRSTPTTVGSSHLSWRRYSSHTTICVPSTRTRNRIRKFLSAVRHWLRSGWGTHGRTQKACLGARREGYGEGGARPLP